MPQSMLGLQKDARAVMTYVLDNLSLWFGYIILIHGIHDYHFVLPVLCFAFRLTLLFIVLNWQFSRSCYSYCLVWTFCWWWSCSMDGFRISETCGCAHSGKYIYKVCVRFVYETLQAILYLLIPFLYYLKYP